MITQAYLKSILHYNPKTGTFTWRVRKANRIEIDDVAGSVQGPTGKTYLCIRIDNVIYRAHWLAFLWMVGRWPKNQVDHADRNRFNNSWSNLRECTPSQNSANSKKPITNTSGRKGVTWNKDRNKWQAQIQVNGRNIHLGLFTNLKQAADCYFLAAKKYFGEFARTA